MTVSVLTHDFSLAGVIDVIDYLKYSECFYEAGEIELRIPFKKEYYEILKPPARLLVEKLVFTIERFECSGGQICVRGRGIFYEFKQMQITKPGSLTGKPSALLKYLASQMSFEGITYKVYGITDSSGESKQTEFEWCTSYYDMISRICYESELGFRIILDPDDSMLKFLIWNIADRATDNALAYTVISDRRDGYTDFESVLDISNYKTCFEFVYRITATGSYSSFVYDRTSEDESKRCYVAPASIIADTTEEALKFIDTKAKRAFKSHRKIRSFRLTLHGEPKHTIGDLCYVENTALGECANALLTKREIEKRDTGYTETLTLEVK